MIDLLNRPLSDAKHAERTATGLRLVRPWGWLRPAPVTLKTGWYTLRVEGGPVCVQLFSTKTAKLIELSATPESPAYVRLEGGTFEVTLFCGVRPGDYSVTGIGLAPMSLPNRADLLGGRFLQALGSGMSPARLYALVARTLRPDATYGLRAAGAHQAGAQGVLATADRTRVSAFPARLPPLTFLVQSISGRLEDSQRAGLGLDAQTWPHFTLDPSVPHEVVIRLDPQEILTPDALALFAQAFDRDDTRLVLADIWQSGVPTTRTAFDPLLYADAFPTPYAHRRGFVPNGVDWATLQAASTVISAPLADRADTAPLPPAVVPILPEHRPLASIIIPTRDRADLLEAALNGLFDATLWPHEVIIVDNGSIEPATFALFETLRAKGLRVITADMPFNFSTLSNLGAAAARGDYLIFMNNDVVLDDPDWLSHMMTQAMRPQAGAVGARLLYGDRRLQHAGVALGLTEVCGHLWRGLSFEDQAKVPAIIHDGLRSAVTAALMCVDRQKFDSVGGFDAIAFPVTLNDVDLCLKLQAKGWYNIYAARAVAYHLEGETRGEDEAPVKRARRQAELNAFRPKWAAQIENDPWLPPAIMRSTETFGLK